jgi:hypothetical protein
MANTTISGCGALPRPRPDASVATQRQTAGVPATVGRASFISYVSLQWLVDFTPRCAGFDAALVSPAVSLAYLLLITSVMFVIAYTWDRYGGNRLLTVD